jgi:DNA-binding transcriptional regulator YiaG/tetratricopeptide (TPR) repeat protein
MQVRTAHDSLHQNSASPPAIRVWSGRETRLLREAMRLSIRDFAAMLGINERLISKWEAGGSAVHPRPANQQVLDTALAGGDDSVHERFWLSAAQDSAGQVSAHPPAGTGAGSDLSLADGPADQASDACRRAIAGTTLFGEEPSGEDLLAAAEAVRREVEDTLARGTISPTRLDRLEELVANHIRFYTMTAPAHALANLLADFRDVQRLAAERQPAMIQARLSELSASLATLAADSLMKLGQIPDARAWYGTAQVAADDSGNIELRARVRAQHAMLPYYYGHAAEAVRLAQDAQRILGDAPRPTRALAAAAEARALSRMGNEPGARRAIELAQELVTRASVSGTRESDDAFVFGTKRMLLYASGTMTNLGDDDAARSFQRQALDHYSDTAGLIDPALLLLDQVQLLVAEGDMHEAGELAAKVISSLPAPQRTLIFAARLRQIIAIIPGEHDAPGRFKDILNQLLTRT